MGSGQSEMDSRRRAAPVLCALKVVSVEAEGKTCRSKMDSDQADRGYIKGVLRKDRPQARAPSARRSYIRSPPPPRRAAHVSKPDRSKIQVQLRGAWGGWRRPISKGWKIKRKPLEEANKQAHAKSTNRSWRAIVPSARSPRRTYATPAENNSPRHFVASQIGDGPTTDGPPASPVAIITRGCSHDSRYARARIRAALFLFLVDLAGSKALIQINAPVKLGGMEALML